MSDPLVWLGAAIIAIFLAYMNGRVSGAEKERHKQAQARQKARDKAAKIDSEVDAMKGDEAREELSKWSR